MKKHWWNSLRVRIVAWSFVPTAIILSAVAWFTFYSYQKVIGDLAIKQDWGIVQSKTPPLYQAFFDITNPLIVEIILQVDTQRDAVDLADHRHHGRLVGRYGGGDPGQVRANGVLAAETAETRGCACWLSWWYNVCVEELTH